MSVQRAGQRLIYPAGYDVVSPRGGAAPWWDSAYAAYGPDTAADLTASYTDLSGNERNLPGTGTPPTHSLGSGWVFVSASSQYLISTINDSAMQSVLIKFSGVGLLTGSGKFLFGTAITTGTFNGFNIGQITTNKVFRNGSAALSISGPETSGVFAIAGQYAYYNGVQLAGTMPNDTRANLAIYIGGRNFGGSASNYVDAAIAKIAFWTSILTPGEVAEKTALM